MKTEKPRKQPLTSSVRDQLRRLIGLHGESEVVRAVGTRPETLWRAMAGLKVHAGTRAAVEAALAKLAAERGAA